MTVTLRTNAASSARGTTPIKPTSLEDAASRIRNVLKGKADAMVNVDGFEERVEVRYASKDEAKVKKALAALGMKSSFSGIRDLHSLGAYEVVLSPWQPVFPA